MEDEKADNLEVGYSLGHYRIAKKLGAGGMGEVYLAEDSRLRRKIALKVLPKNIAQDKDRLRRFEQEALAASALNHPNILTIYEFGAEGEWHFLATEFVDGETLRERMNREPLGLREVLDVAIQIAAALNAAHEAKIVHRDIKPENIILRDDRLVKVLDFGLAKLIEKRNEAVDTEGETRAHVNTKPGMVIGTVAYMSPEQARGKDTDSRSDIWSLGVVLYEMLAGCQPFTGETTTDTLAIILHREPVPLDENTPPELNRIVRKALQKNRDERYQTIKDLLLDLKNLKRELELAEEIERSHIPPLAKSANVSTIQSSENATATYSPNLTAAISTQNSISPQTSSAEYIVGEVKKHKFASLGVLAVLVVALLVGGYFAFFAKRAASQFDSIAVLPFVNASGNQETEFLSDGISETLINNFTRIPALRVTARSTAFRYKGKDTEPQTVGKELNVSAILTGKVLQRGDSLSVHVDLINVADGTQIWGNQYNGKASEILDIQQKIARDVSEQLKLKLSGAQEEQITKNYTANSEAYQFYLKGRFYWNRRTAENLQKAIQEFQQAADKDPNYALAFVGLADCYTLLEQYAGKPTSETLPKAKIYAERALAIDDLLAEAHASLGLINDNSWKWAEAEREYKRAIELKPNYPTVHHWYSILLQKQGRPDDALKEIKRAQELDPLSGVINVNVTAVYLRKGDTNSAVENGRRLIELDPNYWQGHSWLGLAYLTQGRNAEALAEIQKGVELSNGTIESISFLGYASAVAGRRGEAVSIIKELKERYAKREALGQNIAAVYAGLGDKNAAFAWLEKDFQVRSGGLLNIRWYPTFEPLRGDPRYADLLRRMNVRQ